MLAEAAILEGEWTPTPSDPGTVQEWAERWLAGAHHLAPRTARNTRIALAKHVIPALGDILVPDLTRQQVEDWVATLIQRGYAPDTIRLAVSSLRGALTAAERAGVATRRPADRLGLPRPRKRELNVLSPEEVDHLCAVLPTDQDRLVVLLATYCGLRAGEIAGLTVERVDISTRRLTVVEAMSEVDGELVRKAPKTNRVRTVPIPEVVVPILVAVLSSRPADAGAPLFEGGEGKPWRYASWYRHHFRPAVQQIGRGELRFHDLRHTYASWLIRSGVHPHTVMTLLGHSSITVTMNVYGHLMPDSASDAAARLDALANEARECGKGTIRARKKTS